MCRLVLVARGGPRLDGEDGCVAVTKQINRPGHEHSTLFTPVDQCSHTNTPCTYASWLCCSTEDGLQRLIEAVATMCSGGSCGMYQTHNG